MATDALVKPLLRVALFVGLKPLQITEIVRRADRFLYRPGEVIIRESEVGDAAVLIVGGEAVRVRGPGLGVPAERIPEDALVGEMAMLIETEHTSTVVARTAVKALRITRRALHAQMADDPALAHHFVDRIRLRLEALAGELRAIDGTLAGVVGANAPLAGVVGASAPLAGVVNGRVPLAGAGIAATRAPPPWPASHAHLN
ncbi:MAG: cyclic nucleotide-binding domain-containing protein [Hyphomicrobium sp.]